MKTLIYFADPMCSWCWGFTPVLEKIKEKYQDQQNKIKIALILGGLQPGEKNPLLPQQREEILHHWQEIEKLTGQPFKTSNALPDGFIYDTEPAARAVVTVANMAGEKLFSFFKKLQFSFYAEGMDITKPEIIQKLVIAEGIESFRFMEKFHSEEIKLKTKANFHNARKYSILTLPSTVMKDESDVRLLCGGYCTYPEAEIKLDKWLASGE